MYIVYSPRDPTSPVQILVDGILLRSAVVMVLYGAVAIGVGAVMDAVAIGGGAAMHAVAMGGGRLRCLCGSGAIAMMTDAASSPSM